MVTRHPKWKLTEVIVAVASVASAINILQSNQRPHNFATLMFFGAYGEGPCKRCGVKPEENLTLPRPCLSLSAQVEPDSEQDFWSV